MAAMPLALSFAPRGAPHRVVMRSDQHDLAGRRGAGKLGLDVAHGLARHGEGLRDHGVTQTAQRGLDVGSRFIQRLGPPQMPLPDPPRQRPHMQAQPVAQLRLLIGERRQRAGVSASGHGRHVPKPPHERGNQREPQHDTAPAPDHARKAHINVKLAQRDFVPLSQRERAGVRETIMANRRFMIRGGDSP